MLEADRLRMVAALVEWQRQDADARSIVVAICAHEGVAHIGLLSDDGLDNAYDAVLDMIEEIPLEEIE